METKQKKMKKGKKVFLIILAVLLAIILVVGILGFSYIKDLVDKMNGGNSEKETEEISEEDVFKDYEYTLQPVDGFINILILGVDTRDMDQITGNTDMMIVCSINEETYDITLTSFYRDTYVKHGSSSKYGRINAAFSRGGTDMVIETINQMLDIDIEYYAMVNFKGVADMIDSVGGIDIEVLESELSQLNQCIKSSYEALGYEDENYPLISEAGTHHINGIQALAYGRIRKDSSDVRRTERMRIVITKTLEKVKTMKPSEIKTLIDNMVSEIRTNMGLTDIFGLAKHVTKYNVTNSYGWPYYVKHATYEGKWLFFPDTLSKNAIWFHETVFGETDYTPSGRLKQISAILEDTYNEAKNGKKAEEEEEEEPTPEPDPEPDSEPTPEPES